MTVKADGSPVPNVSLVPVIPILGGGSGSAMTLAQIVDASYGSGMSANVATVGSYPYSIDLVKSGACSVANDVALWKTLPTVMTGKSIFAIAKTAPVGAALKGDVLSSPDGITFTSLTGGTGFSIADGGNASGLTALTVTSFSVNDIFRLDITQVGSGTAGSDLTVTLFGNAAQ